MRESRTGALASRAHIQARKRMKGKDCGSYEEGEKDVSTWNREFVLMTFRKVRLIGHAL